MNSSYLNNHFQNAFVIYSTCNYVFVLFEFLDRIILKCSNVSLNMRERCEECLFQL